MKPADLLEAATVSHETLKGALDADWNRPAGLLDWTCRRTLDHIPDTMLLYAAHLATRTARPLPFLRNGDPDAPLKHLLRSAQSSAAILAEVASAAETEGVATGAVVRAYHPAGMADPGGFVAMGCDEVLVHTYDIATGLELPFVPPAELCRRVVARLFPWAPLEVPDESVEPWSVLLWANGRGALPQHPMLAPDWYWHSAPLDEWDGAAKTRSAPPAWSS